MVPAAKMQNNFRFYDNNYHTRIKFTASKYGKKLKEKQPALI